MTISHTIKAFIEVDQASVGVSVLFMHMYAGATGGSYTSYSHNILQCYGILQQEKKSVQGGSYTTQSCSCGQPALTWLHVHGRMVKHAAAFSDSRRRQVHHALFSTIFFIKYYWLNVYLHFLRHNGLSVICLVAVRLFNFGVRWSLLVVAPVK